MPAPHRARSIAVSAFVAATVLAGCTQRAHTTLLRAGAPSEVKNADASPLAADTPVSSADSAPRQRPFAWDRVLVVGWETVGGPGLASVATVGQQLSVMVGAGPPTLARVVDVNRDMCDDGGPPQTCLYVGVEYGSESGG